MTWAGFITPTPDNDMYMFLRENLQMSYDRVPTHAFTFMISYNLGEFALRVLDRRLVGVGVEISKFESSK